MQVDVYADAMGFDVLRSEWNALLADSWADSLFLTWEWQHVWWRELGAGELRLLAARDDANRLLGIAPLYLGRDNGQRVLTLVGCVDVSDYLDIIVRRGCEALVYEALLTALAEHRARWDRLALCNIAAASPTLRYLPELATRWGWTVTDNHEDVCPVIVLPATWEEYLAGLAKHQRHEVRRKLRRVGEEAEAVRRVHTEVADLEAALEVFLRLHRLSHVDKATFMDERMTAFFWAMTRVMGEQGYVELNTLELDGVPAAAMYNFRYHDRLLVYNSGYDPGLRPNLSSGIVLLSQCIQDAIERGLRVFDFLQGNEEYKYRFGAADTELRRLSIAWEAAG